MLGLPLVRPNFVFIAGTGLYFGIKYAFRPNRHCRFIFPFPDGPFFIQSIFIFPNTKEGVAFSSAVELNLNTHRALVPAGMQDASLRVHGFDVYSADPVNELDHFLRLSAYAVA